MALPQIGLNGYFGNISGPFAANEEIITKIQRDCNGQIDYLSKIGIHCIGDFDFDISDLKTYQKPMYVIFNQDQENLKFQIGRTRMLELQDVKITSIKFPEETDDRVFIDYQYISKGKRIVAVVGTAIVGTDIVG